MTKTKVFALFPGRVRSRKGGKVRHVQARSLIKLYGLDPEECVVHTMDDHTMGWLVNLIPLCPRSRGDYSDHLFVTLVRWLEGSWYRGGRVDVS